jgi:hypothetical protein
MTVTNTHLCNFIVTSSLPTDAPTKPKVEEDIRQSTLIDGDGAYTQSVETSQEMESVSSDDETQSVETSQGLKAVSSDEDFFSSIKISRKRRCSNELERFDSSSNKFFALPDPNEDISPDDFLVQLIDAVYGYKFEAKPTLLLKGFFGKVSEEQMVAYNTDVVAAVRNNELDQLKRLHQNGQAMNCFNRFGESLLNIACRRGFEDVVRYLLDQPDVSVRYSDDCGRTPLHDTCWNPSPQLTICKWILERDPALFFAMDRRGCTAFQYARPEHWPIWRKFLLDNRDSLKGLTDPDIRSRLYKA